MDYYEYDVKIDLPGTQINSLVNTLTQLTEVNKVKILINGNDNEEFNEVYTINKQSRDYN